MKIRTLEIGELPLLQALSLDGSEVRDNFAGRLPDTDVLLRVHRAMLTTRIMDDRMLKLQRQGRVAFVGTSKGQEAAIHASAEVFIEQDWIFSALREGGVTLQRGMPVREYVAHMFGNAEDTAKGRQMPNHFQCKEVNFPSWSSVLGTQLPHAVGVALAMRRRNENSVVAAYTGDGATSSCGFHSALNFAAVMKAPVVFIVIDNGWAISVPSANQTAAKSYGTKAKAYGMPGVDIDGNDALAVYSGVEEAVERARRGDGPTLVNLRSYRMDGHSSSDDPSRYRNAEEVNYWEKVDPLKRLEAYLSFKGVLEQSAIEEMDNEITREIAESVRHAEAVADPPLESLVEDVYAVPPRHLTRQVIDALRVVDKHGEADSLQGKFPL